MPLDIIVVGAGIAGLSAAIGLARTGHNVTVHERRDSTKREDSGSGIQIQPNVVQILDDWGLMPEIRKVAHDPELVDLRTYNEGSVAKQDYRPLGPAPFGLRRVLKDIFRDHAIQQSVKICEGQGIDHVDVDHHAIILSDGRTVTAGLVLGADGSNSRVRKTLFPDSKPTVLEQCAFQVLVPLNKVQQDPEMREILDEQHVIIISSPGRSVFASPAPYHDLMVIQFVDHEYPLEGDPHPDQHNMKIKDLT
ncbi:FAD-dependent monooxygenase OpS4 [Fulvia fulva]|uniref:FAD-dependent monooxygenase OpS4 n=1 Tax=Passalora fulva TaxID=5499 RepID=A0A9Q8P9R0_PASFU|nr:FAD-dependent monooxygenase OpS4 [Fulvia fulva]KAK4622261.1 FAD-dependent monooxygenase OpS4 [Fulvia fulva]KAK4623406.1 FAD-dependent monooxygenase OpS4 [Fulvia fulva]UJO18555.1 FAD-dependent monooxygenase OpS4 [Fulvia fulva]WPV16162.1 FAD-dependent monooxygenase OpS4 [Fulvia fulva]WPV31590.1 FAD-dependent monooxygenase OpS4 [Fulvia fulva]